jgi:GAF domain-containing protein
MSDPGLRKLSQRLHSNLAKDSLVQATLDQLRNSLQVERVVLYYFYCHWQGQVTFESLKDQEFSIFGSTGADECFNGEYAQLYQVGRVRAIADIETETINECHRNFLREIKVRANLVVPVLNPQGLWGLLIAHSCSLPRPWSPTEIEVMVAGAKTLATCPAIKNS